MSVYIICTGLNMVFFLRVLHLICYRIYYESRDHIILLLKLTTLAFVSSVLPMSFGFIELTVQPETVVVGLLVRDRHRSTVRYRSSDGAIMLRQVATRSRSWDGDRRRSVAPTGDDDVEFNPVDETPFSNSGDLWRAPDAGLPVVGVTSFVGLYKMIVHWHLVRLYWHPEQSGDPGDFRREPPDDGINGDNPGER